VLILASSEQRVSALYSSGDLVNKPSVYEIVTKSIIEQLKSNLVPWVQPWSSDRSSLLPYNAVSQRHYRGVNVLLLWAAAETNRYKNPAWLTFKQAQELGGTVKKGEKATPIVYASSFKKTETPEAGEENKKDIRFLKFYYVFNLEQTTGLPGHLCRVPEEKPLEDRLHHVEAFIEKVGANVHHGGERAYYSPSTDVIVLPPMKDFESPAHYYATSLHEHVHFSGHPSRLNRDLTGRFGSRSYAAEELVAELGAAFLCSFLEIKAELRHASYVASWLELLENDSKAIFTAASAASKAADYLRSFSK
jgi:antirestriction protein ArdC